MYILNGVKNMNKSHTKYILKNPKQDICKLNSVIF